MPNPTEAVTKAEELAYVIERDWPGFDAPVPQVWDVQPNVRLGLAGTSGQQHCAGSVARVFYDVGLEPGTDFPWPFCYCPAIASASDARGFHRGRTGCR